MNPKAVHAFPAKHAIEDLFRFGAVAVGDGERELSDRDVAMAAMAVEPRLGGVLLRCLS
jgi:hypothetical protein